MMTLGAFLHRWRAWRKPPVPARPQEHDQIGAHLHAAIVADERAKLNNVQTYGARVDAMIEDFFSKYGNRDARHDP